MTDIFVAHKIGETAIIVEGAGTHLSIGGVELILNLGNLVTRGLIQIHVGGPGGGLGLEVLLQVGTVGVDAGRVVFDGIPNGVDGVMGDFIV